ncbi:MAG: DUF5815 family protein [Halanaeroarchaeum sp.]
MAHPGVPGETEDDAVELPCGRAVPASDIHLGMREYDCACGDAHAVVLDPHPLSRFVPEDIADSLRAAIETSPDDEFEEFTTAHLMGSLLEEHPEEVAVHDAAANGNVGYALCWVAGWDARTLHERVVDLVLDLMEHAVSHADDEDATAEFEETMADFDVEAFVEEYRDVRDFEDEWDDPV